MSRTEQSDLLIADGLDEAFIGVAHRFGIYEPVAAYDREKCIEILMLTGMDRESAEEHFEYNIIGAWVGEQTPIFIERLTLQEVRLGDL